MLGVGTIVGGAFALIRERPAAVGVWAALYFLVTAGSSFAMRPFLRMAAEPAAQPDAAGAMTAFGQMMLAQLLALVVVMVIFTATQRAALRPEAGGVGYLRLGIDEVRMIGLTLFLAIIFYIGLVVVILALALVIGMSMSMSVPTAGSGPTGAAILVMGLLFLAVFLFAIWLQVRISLAFSLTFLRGRIVIGEAWRLSRGRFWTLFAGYLVVTLVLILVWLAAAVVTQGAYSAELIAGGFSFEAMDAAAQRQTKQQLGDVTPTMVLGWAVTALAGALGVTLYGGATAAAVRALVGGPEQEVAETFA